MWMDTQSKIVEELDTSRSKQFKSEIIYMMVIWDVYYYGWSYMLFVVSSLEMGTKMIFHGKQVPFFLFRI